MADLIDKAKSALQTTSMSDVVTAGVRGVRAVESGLQSVASKGRKFVSDHTPESVKAMYRDARGYTVKPRSQTSTRSQTRR